MGEGLENGKVWGVAEEQREGPCGLRGLAYEGVGIRWSWQVRSKVLCPRAKLAQGLGRGTGQPHATDHGFLWPAYILGFNLILFFCTFFCGAALGE